MQLGLNLFTARTPPPLLRVGRESRYWLATDCSFNSAILCLCTVNAGARVRQIGNPVSKSANRDALPRSAQALLRPILVPRVLSRSARKMSDKQPKARLGRWLEKVQLAWHEFQTSLARDAVYDYLQTVFAIVMHFKARRTVKRLLRHAFEFADQPFDKSADPFTAVIRCTCGGTAEIR
jgi:hypothetical protein